MPEPRPWWVSLGWTARDYLKRVWDHAAENNVLFLAGGIAFNILLAAVPFFLLLVTGLTYLLPAVTRLDPTVATTGFIETLLPPTGASSKWVHDVLMDIVNARGTVTFYSALLFVWLSTRLFGSLRSALADVFDIESERGIIQGKIFDIKITVVGTVLFVASTLVNTYIALATTRGLAALQRAGLRQAVMSGMEYWIGRFLVFAFIALMFFALYKFLPIRKVRTSTAWIAALFSASLLEVAKLVFYWVLPRMDPQSIYTGTLAALVIVVVWVYYAALIFPGGGGSRSGVRAQADETSAARSIFLSLAGPTDVVRLMPAVSTGGTRVAHVAGSQGGTTMKKGILVLAALALVACTKTGENEYEVERPGLVTDTVTTPELTTKVDTLTVPTVGTKKDTIIIDKPVVGTKRTEVKTPTVKKP